MKKLGIIRSGWDMVTRGLQDEFPPSPALQFCIPKPIPFAFKALTGSKPNTSAWGSHRFGIWAAALQCMPEKRRRVLRILKLKTCWSV